MIALGGGFGRRFDLLEKPLHLSVQFGGVGRIEQPRDGGCAYCLHNALPISLPTPMN
jgi:hypothetical protein